MLRRKLSGIICAFIFFQIILLFSSCTGTSSELVVNYGHISMQGNIFTMFNTWHTKEYLCDYFNLKEDEFMLLSLNQKRTTIDHDPEQINEIIAILNSATYIPHAIEPDDYEYVELLFLHNNQSIKARVIFAYRYSDQCMYAFYLNKCYQLQNYDTAKKCLGKLSRLPKDYHQIYAGTDVFFYDRFFYDESRDDYYTYSGEFINTIPTEITTKEDIQRLAIKEIADRIEIVWPPEFENFPEYKEITTLHTYYDKFSENWRVEVFLYYPLEIEVETVNGSPAKGSGIIVVYLNREGCTIMIRDLFEVFSSKLTKWLKIEK